MRYSSRSQFTATRHFSRRRIAASVVGALAAAATTMYSASVGYAQDASLVAEAKKEGQVVWYTTLLVDQAVRPLVAAFEAKYPGIKVNFARYNSGELSLRVVNEAQAGKPQVDLVDGSLVPLYKTDHIVAYRPEVASQYAKQFVEEDGRGVSFLMYVLGPGINTELVKPADAPKTFEDLLDPKWAGKIAWSANPGLDGGPGFVALVLLSMGQEKGMDYLRKLSKQKLANIPAASRVVLDQVIAGQYPLSLVVFNHHAAISAGKGAPAKFVDMEPLLGLTHVLNLANKAPHPNAAKLLYDFVVSEEGQTVLRDAGYIPTHPKVGPKIKELNPLTAGFKVEWINAKRVVENMNDYIKIYNELFK
jgi:ABC-type Fe3+ transport system substrate-binding protein